MNKIKVNLNETYLFPVNESIEWYNSIFGYYFIPTISACGFLINLISLFRLNKYFNDNKIYGYLRCKFTIDMVICILVIGFQNAACTYCTKNKVNVLSLQIYRVYFLRIMTGENILKFNFNVFF